MFSQMNSCARRFQLNYMEEQFPGPGEPINFYQMNPQSWAFQQGFQDNLQYFHEFPGIPDSDRTSSDSRSSPGNEETGFQETCVQESEAVDELLQILVECLKKADMRTREVLLRKFFVEIEKETAMEGFLIERIKHSKINVFSNSLSRTPSCCRDNDRIPVGDIYESATREVDRPLGEGTSIKLGRFKVKTVQFGQVVKEEAK
ncbi:hypothetical protein Salat_2346500 [Sesamum alatum]|uniref:Uncharacterized protein n=1 Tax=Sesamum alatum TaxID=300844 RepID=A0AAE1XWJ7_9LAMI|nr:hypothetical protein Salat_2346500 [Sesamum alatum]